MRRYSIQNVFICGPLRALAGNRGSQNIVYTI